MLCYTHYEIPLLSFSGQGHNVLYVMLWYKMNRTCFCCAVYTVVFLSDLDKIKARCEPSLCHQCKLAHFASDMRRFPLLAKITISNSVGQPSCSPMCMVTEDTSTSRPFGWTGEDRSESFNQMQWRHWILYQWSPSTRRNVVGKATFGFLKENRRSNYRNDKA